MNVAAATRPLRRPFLTPCRKCFQMCRVVISPTPNTSTGATRMWALSIHGWSGWLMTAQGSAAVIMSFIHQYATPVTSVPAVLAQISHRSKRLIVTSPSPFRTGR